MRLAYWFRSRRRFGISGLWASAHFALWHTELLYQHLVPQVGKNLNGSSFGSTGRGFDRLHRAAFLWNMSVPNLLKRLRNPRRPARGA
jgi:hypothetical protein